MFISTLSHAHGGAEGGRSFIEQSTNPQLFAFVYLGANHTVTGYDHLLFLLGVIFLLYMMCEAGMAGKETSQGNRKRQHPLPHRHLWDVMVNQMARGLCIAPRGA